MSIFIVALLAMNQFVLASRERGAVADIAPAAAEAPCVATTQRFAPELDSGFTGKLQANMPGTVFIDLSFADDSVGYACAELGIVYKTTDAGVSWTRIMNLGFPYYWYGVSALSRERAMVSGFNNTDGTGIYRWTTDGGVTWDSIVTLDTANWLSRAHFTDSLHGIISAGWVGGIWRTENGGRNASDWSYVQVDPARAWFAGNFCYRTDGRCWLTGISFCASTDNGATWNVQHSADPTFDGGVWFTDTLHGWTGGGEISPAVAGWVHRTTDGGASWSDRLIETPEPIRAVLFLNETLGFAVGGNHFTSVGAIYSTTDGGDSWRPDVNTGAEMDGIDYRVVGDSVDLWCCGFDNSFKGYIYKARISVTASGVAESGAGSRFPTRVCSLRPTILRSLPAGTVAFDAMGRGVVNPRSGVYFVPNEPQASIHTPGVLRKVVIQP